MRASFLVYTIISTMVFIASGLQAETPQFTTASGDTTEKNIVSIEQVKELFILLVGSPKQEHSQSVAVFPFDSSFPGRMIGEVGVDFFSDHPNFWVVNKVSYVSVINTIPAKGNYQDLDQIITAGTDMGVTFCVVGSVQKKQSDYIINTKMIQVEQKRIIAEITARIAIKQFDTDIKKTCHFSDNKIIPYYATLQSGLLPGLGQRYYGYNIRGYTLMGLAAVGLGGTIYLAYQYSERQDELQLYKDYHESTIPDGLSPSEWVAAADNAREERNTAATRLNIAFAGLGLLWLYNVVDAFILDKKIEKKIPAVYFSYTPGVKTLSPDRAYLSVTLRL